MELTKQRNYQQAFDLACASLREMDLEERSKKAGALYRKSDIGAEIVIDFFTERYRISLPQFEFSLPTKKAVSLVTRVLLLHYLVRANGAPMARKWVGYKDIPGGLLYSAVFARRVTEPLVRKFGNAPGRFMETGIQLGGEPQEIGDTSFIVRALPCVSLHYVLWKGDEEFPPSVQVLFDASVDQYLLLEDIVVLGQMATGRLIHRANLADRAPGS